MTPPTRSHTELRHPLADLSPARLVGDDAPVGRDHRNTEPIADLGQILHPSVDPAARARNPLQAVDHRFAVVGVLEVDTDSPLRTLLEHLEGADVPFLF